MTATFQGPSGTSPPAGLEGAPYADGVGVGVGVGDAVSET